MQAAEGCLPASLRLEGRPSIFLERRSVRLVGLGEASAGELAEAQAQFYQETRWRLEVVVRKLAAPSSPTTKQAVPRSQPQSATPSPPSASRGARGWPLQQQEALERARAMLGALSEFQKVGIDKTQHALLVRFDFPDRVMERYRETMERLEHETGWRVHLHPTARQEALIEQARRLLPAGLRSAATPSIYWEERVVGLQCAGTADPQAIEEAERLFTEQTGWRLTLMLSGQEVAGRLSQAEALAQASQRLQATQGLYQVGVDTKRGIVWLHYHFPAVARERYAEAFAQLAQATGWRVELHPRVHQKALVDLAYLLLPAPSGLSGKPSIHEAAQRLVLTVRGPLSEEIAQDVRQRFGQETGWTLDLQFPQAQPRETQGSTSERPTRMGEAQAMTLVRTTLKEPSLRLLVDAVRGILVLSKASPAAQQRYEEQREALQERTGWQIELVQATNDERMQTEVRLALEGTGLHVAKILLLPEEQRAVAQVQGTCKLPALVAGQEMFNEKTGWILALERS